MQIKQRITPFLSYVDRAEEAAKFYVSVLPDSRILRTVANLTDNSALIVEFELAGMKLVDEIDRLWEKLIADGGCELACGWLKDKFGMSWQIVPSQLQQWIGSDDPQRVQRMFEALWQMTKLNIAVLQNAFDGHA